MFETKKIEEEDFDFEEEVYNLYQMIRHCNIVDCVRLRKGDKKKYKKRVGCKAIFSDN